MSVILMFTARNAENNYTFIIMKEHYQFYLLRGIKLRVTWKKVSIALRDYVQMKNLNHKVACLIPFMCSHDSNAKSKLKRKLMNPAITDCEILIKLEIESITRQVKKFCDTNAAMLYSQRTQDKGEKNTQLDEVRGEY